MKISISKKIFKISALLLAAALSLAACGKKEDAVADCCEGEASNADHAMNASAPTGENVVRVSYGTALCHAPIHIAIEKGFFTEEGLTVEAIPMDTSQTVDGAASGHIDAGYGLFGKFAAPLENGLPIQFTAGIHTGCIKLVTTGDSPINSVADLRGKKIGVSSLTDSPAIIAKRALAAENIGVTADNMEAEFVVFSNSDLPIALQNGAIDAYASMDPTVSIAVKENNLKVLVDTGASQPFADEYCCAVFVTKDFAKNKPELAAAYTRAVMRASLWIEENPLETAKIQIEKAYVSGDAEFNAELLSGYVFTPSVERGDSSLDTTLEELQNIGILQASTDIKKLSDDSFIVFENFNDPTKE
jgi:NitT/TauT family transport system substrate-binding protein